MSIAWSPPPIDDHALVGDGATAALIGGDGALDFLCWPRFDSEAGFAALLGTERHGLWRLAIEGTRRRRYLPASLVLETRIAAPGGRARLIEFMPPGGVGGTSSVIRLVEALEGVVECSMELRPGFRFGACAARIESFGEGLLARPADGGGAMLLRGDRPTRHDGEGIAARFSLAAGQSAWFCLGWIEDGGSGDRMPAPCDPLAELARTEAFWRGWHARGNGAGGAAAEASLTMLKALCHGRSGAPVAAVTTSLPEQPGGTRNWDYRFCWVRDAALMMSALMQAGHGEEMRAWLGWLERAMGPDAAAWRVLYTLDGAAPPPERQLDWLPGHRGARPVRVGNAAAGQLQLDPVGTLAQALHQARTARVIGPDEGWALQCALLERLAGVWRQPDAGIWEVRGPPRRFTYSSLLAWVAFDRGIADAVRWALPCPLARWRAIRAAIRRHLLRTGLDPRTGGFVQYPGAAGLDAALLLLPRAGLLRATDPRLRATIDAIGAGLVRDGLVWRYGSESGVDGLPPGEGAFIACGFWMAEALALTGRVAEARKFFDRHAGLANEVGLLCEEYDPCGQGGAGNLPQGLSHAGLVSAAVAIAAAG